MKKAWVALVTKTAYLPGVLVVHRSLQDVHTKYPLVVMVTPTVSAGVREVLARQEIGIREIEHLHPDLSGPDSVVEERFADTWTKLRAFGLVEYDRVVLVDADMVVRRNMDELMDMPLEKGWIAATNVCACNPRKLTHYPEDWIPENCGFNSPEQPPPMNETSPRPYGQLNSGLVVLCPSESQNTAILQFLFHSPLVSELQFPDQDLLSIVYKGKWKHVMWYYNALRTLRIVHKNLWEDDDMVRCCHYILKDKPWSCRPGPETKDDVYDELNRWWWTTFEALGETMSKSEIGRKDWALLQDHVAAT